MHLQITKYLFANGLNGLSYVAITIVVISCKQLIIPFLCNNVHLYDNYGCLEFFYAPKFVIFLIFFESFFKIIQ